jgi:hypothetical protein
MRAHPLLFVFTLANALVVSCTLSGARSAEPAIADVVRARKIELVDASGQPRVQLEVEETGEAVLRMRDPKGQIRVKLGTSAEGSGLLLLNDATEPGIQALSGTTAKLTLRNVDGKEHVLAP